MLHYWLFWFSGHPTQWQDLEDWPEANGENTFTLHVARSWEPFQCSACAPFTVVPRGSQLASGYIWLHNYSSQKEKILCKESILLWAIHGHCDY